MIRVYILAYIIATITIISGCATQGTNISKNGRVTINRTASEKIKKSGDTTRMAFP